MQSINKLGVKVVGITALAVLAVFGIYQGFKQVFLREGAQTAPTETTSPSTPGEAKPAGDISNDRLSQVAQEIYRTNPELADMVSGSGSTSDAAGLSEGAVPDPNTYTGRYLATLPPNASRDQVLNQQQLAIFIEKERGVLLPENIAVQQLPPGAPQDKKAVQTYLESISSSHNQNISPVTNEDIEAAFRLHYQSGQSQLMDELVKKLENNLAILKSVAAPNETVELHQKLLAASQALLNNVRLLQNMNKDLVGGLVGAKNIEDLGPVFEEIASQVKALEKKYNLS